MDIVVDISDFGPVQQIIRGRLPGAVLDDNLIEFGAKVVSMVVQVPVDQLAEAERIIQESCRGSAMISYPHA